MLKALGISKKSKPAADDSIAKHKEQQALRDQWRTDTQQAQAIISKLSQAYGNHKGDFALSRYEGLKNMIKEAIKEAKAHVEATKNRTADKYEAKVRGQAVSAPSGGGHKGGMVTKLRQSAQGFMQHNEERQKDYRDMTAKEVEEDLTRFRREILQYKQDYRHARDCLDKLAKSYEDSKKLSPPQRYNELKVMIKEITRPASNGESAPQPTAAAKK